MYLLCPRHNPLWRIMGVVSLTRELQEEPGDTVDPPEPAEPARVGEENFTMSVSSSTFSVAWTG